MSYPVLCTARGGFALASLILLAAATGCAETSTPNTTISASTTIQGTSPAKNDFAVYGFGEITTKLNESDPVARTWSVMEIIAGDRPDFCERVIPTFDGKILTAIGASVAGTYLHTVLVSPTPPVPGKVISVSDPDTPVIFVRYSVSDGKDQSAVALSGFLIPGDNSLRVDAFAPGAPFSGHLSSTIYNDVNIVIDPDGGSVSGSGDVAVQADFDRVEECPALSEYIRSFKGL